MKDDKDIVIDALLARIRELEADKRNQQYTIKRLNINDYLFGQFIFRDRDKLLNDFSKFAMDNYKECSCNYGYENIEQQVIDTLEDLADGIDLNKKDNFKNLFGALGELESNIS